MILSEVAGGRHSRIVTLSSVNRNVLTENVLSDVGFSDLDFL